MEDEYRRAIGLRPSYVPALSNLGVILYARGELDGARAHLSEALRLQPGHVGARVNLGAVLRAQGDVDGAAAQYTEALRVDPRSPEAHYNLGNVLLQRGDRDGAVAHYEEALRANYAAAGRRRDHVRSSVRATAMRPIESPIQSPAMPRPAGKQRTTPIGSPTTQWPTRLAYIGVRVSPLPRRTPAATTWIPSKS